MLFWNTWFKHHTSRLYICNIPCRKIFSQINYILINNISWNAKQSVETISGCDCDCDCDCYHVSICGQRKVRLEREKMDIKNNRHNEDINRLGNEVQDRCRLHVRNRIKSNVQNTKDMRRCEMLKDSICLTSRHHRKEGKQPRIHVDIELSQFPNKSCFNRNVGYVWNVLTNLLWHFLVIFI